MERYSSADTVNDGSYTVARGRRRGFIIDSRSNSRDPADPARASEPGLLETGRIERRNRLRAGYRGQVYPPRRRSR